MIFERFGTDRTKALAQYNPDLLGIYCSKPERCMFGNAPTLQALNIAYGKATATAFCIAQLNAINIVSGASRKMTEEQISFAAQALAARMTETPGFKITEGLLFFWNFRLQKYGQFYGQVDPDIILRGFNSFLADRRRAYDNKLLEDNKPPVDIELQRKQSEYKARLMAETNKKRERTRLTAEKD